MHTRAARFGVLAVLLALGAAAAFSMWSAEAQVRALDDRRRTLDAVFDRAMPAVADVAAAQQAYVDYGLRDEATFARVAGRLQQITGEAARFRSSDYSGAATARLEEVWASLAGLTAAETQAREREAAGEPLAAADLLLGSSAQRHAGMLVAALRGFRDAESAAVRAERDRLTTQSRLLLAAVAALWVAGLFALARSPRAPAAEVLDAAPPEPPIVTPAEPGPAARVAEAQTVDLSATAELCNAIARLADTGSLTAILERAATVLDARGIIVWMGAGNELFAAAAIGYDTAVMERLRAIPRSADNATAVTWRTGEPRIVAADGAGLGAIVAPMCGPTDCLGVLAAEVRNGRETDAATRAVAAILAAQLAGVLAAWPAASTGEAPARAAGYVPAAEVSPR